VTRIIGIAGKAGSGKDTVADFIQATLNAKRLLFAAIIKRIAERIFNFTDDQLYGPSSERNAPDPRYGPALSDWMAAQIRLTQDVGPALADEVASVSGVSSSVAFGALLDWFTWLRAQYTGWKFPERVPGARWLPLSRGHALVDEDIYARAQAYSWVYVGKEKGKHTCYAKARFGLRGEEVKLHHFVLDRRVQVDHVNGDGLDNRRRNLRACSDTQNHANALKRRTNMSSRFKGVTFDKSRGKWSAKINPTGKTVNLGRFDTEVKAALAYDVAALQHFGEYARTNESMFLTPRRALQTLGTEYGRTLYEDVWVDLTLAQACDAEVTVITDCRFDNEFRAIVIL